MGHITQRIHNVARFSDFDLVTSEDVEAAESLMPEFYGVLFHNCYQISSSAFYANNRVEILYMKISGIKTIESYAFKNCKNLKTVYLPSDLRSIFNSLFEGCEKMEEIVLPEGLLSIGDEVFRGCSSLEEIIIPESVCTMGADVFRDCNNLHSIKLSKKLVETYGEAYIKSNNDNIKLIIYDEDADEESDKGSMNNAESATLYENEVERKCIKNIEWPMNAKVIEKSAFSKCDKLEWINLPEGLKEIGQCAFYGCESLTDVVIPTTVTEIGKSIFFDCFKLEKIYVPRTLLSRYNEDYFKCNTNAEVICYDSIDDLYEEYNSQINELEAKKEYCRNIVKKAQTEVVTSNGFVGALRKPSTEEYLALRRRPNFSDVTSEQLEKFLKSIPRRASEYNSSNDSTSNPKTVNTIGSERIAASAKEIKSFNGVIRKNLIAEKKKK